MDKLFLTTLLTFSTLSLFSQDSLKRFNGCEIRIQNNWIKQDSGTPPINQDTVSFDQAIISNIEYPYEARRMQIEGDVVFSIEINESGEITKYSIDKDIGSGTNGATALVINNLPIRWIPATFNNAAIESKVKVLIKFHLDTVSTFRDSGIYYKSYLVMATGKAIKAQTFVNQKKKKSKK